MGGDGGTKAVNRSYLRGVGAASTTADAGRQGTAAVDSALAEEEASRSLRTCALTNEPLDFSRPVVACPYGKLYQKEAAIEALLKRKEKVKELLGGHIRGLKDLYRVRYELQNGRPVCPVTGRELGGVKVPAYVLLPGNDDAVNVVSQYAIHQLGEGEILKEYNATEKLRLAPPPDILEHVKKDLAIKRKTKQKKKSKERNSLPAHDEGEPVPKKIKP
jgi:Rtf2 RING-finger